MLYSGYSNTTSFTALEESYVSKPATRILRSIGFAHRNAIKPRYDEKKEAPLPIHNGPEIERHIEIGSQENKNA